jgi:hypothetical protein
LFRCARPTSGVGLGGARRQAGRWLPRGFVGQNPGKVAPGSPRQPQWGGYAHQQGTVSTPAGRCGRARATAPRSSQPAPDRYAVPCPPAPPGRSRDSGAGQPTAPGLKTRCRHYGGQPGRAADRSPRNTANQPARSRRAAGQLRALAPVGRQREPVVGLPRTARPLRPERWPKAEARTVGRTSVAQKAAHRGSSRRPLMKTSCEVTAEQPPQVPRGSQHALGAHAPGQAGQGPRGRQSVPRQLKHVASDL